MTREYDYRETITSDILDYIEENINLSDYADRDELEEALNDELWIADSVTGNASGSYTFNRYEAEENLCHNLDLLKEALDEFSSNCDILENPEACDVTIRCYLLGECLAEALDQLEAEGKLIFKGEEN